MTQENFDLLDLIDHPVFVVDAVSGGAFTYRKSNVANVKMTGIAAADLEGKSPAQVFPVRIAKAIVNNYDRVMASFEKGEYEVLIPGPVGDRRLRTSLTPMMDEDGVVYRLIGSSTDVTKYYEIAEEQMASDIHSQEILKDSEQFVSLAAHDLRTPMRNVKLLAEMLRDDFVDHGDGKMQLIEAMIDVAQRASGLLSEVLSYAQTKQTGPAPDTVFEFSSLCENIVAALDPTSNHVIEFPQVTLNADSVALHVVIRNLIDNALKHGQREQIKVQISLESTPEGLLHFSVRDNGMGMDNPGAVFLQGGAYRTGAGFGLLALKQLIITRGGSISASNSEQGEGGTDISFSFPGEISSEENIAA